MYTLRALGGTPIIRHTVTVAGVQWCLLSDSDAGFSPSLLTRLEGACESVSMAMPSRWDPQFPWRPFTPTASSEPVRPWYFLDPRELQVQASGTPGLAADYQLDLRSLEVCASNLCKKYPEYCGKHPEEYYRISFASLDHIRASQDAMLDRIGFLAWCTAWYDGLSSDLRQLPNQVNIVLEKLRYAFNSRAGVIVDLAKDWRTVNFPLWAYYGVPVLFKWTPAEQGHSRFSHVSPDGFPSTGPLQRRGATYDWFFQDRSRDFDVTPGRGLPHAGNYIIDFEGWKRRPLSKKAAQGYFGTIAFETINTRPSHQALFFRWRTKIPQVYSDDPDFEDPHETARDNAESEEEAIRELYRPNHAPRPDNMYDDNTGLPLGTPLPSLNSPHKSSSRDTAPSRSQTSRSGATPTSQSHSIHRSEWPPPRPAHIDSPWPQTLPVDAWTLPGNGGRESRPDFGRWADGQRRHLPADVWTLPGGDGVWSRPDAHVDSPWPQNLPAGAWALPNDGGWGPRSNFMPRWSPVDASSSLGGSVRTRHSTEGSSQPNFEHRADDQQWPLPQWSPADASSGPERGAHTRRNTRMESHGRPPYQKDKFSAPSNPPISPLSSALQPTASVGPIGSAVPKAAAVSQKPKTKMTFAEYKARKRQLAATECEGSTGTTEGTSHSQSLLPEDAEMLVPDGPPKVRFLRPEFRIFLKLIYCTTVRHTGESPSLTVIVIRYGRRHEPGVATSTKP